MPACIGFRRPELLTKRTRVTSPTRRTKRKPTFTQKIDWQARKARINGVPTLSLGTGRIYAVCTPRRWRLPFTRGMYACTGPRKHKQALPCNDADEFCIWRATPASKLILGAPCTRESLDYEKTYQALNYSSSFSRLRETEDTSRCFHRLRFSGWISSRSGGRKHGRTPRKILARASVFELPKWIKVVRRSHLDLFRDLVEFRAGSAAGNWRFELRILGTAWMVSIN